MESNSNLRSTLNNLIQTCKDGQEGFLTAAENVNDGETKKLFSKYSRQRFKFVEELQTILHGLGENEPEDAGSVAGTAHRGWIILEGVILKQDAHAVLVECERGESSAVADYARALKVEIPANIREILSNQYASILSAHNRVRILADTGAAKWV